MNASAQIRYELATATHVRLGVYNLLGRKIATLVDAPEQPGTHIISWNAGEASPGVYFLRLLAEGYTATQKVVLMK